MSFKKALESGPDGRGPTADQAIGDAWQALQRAATATLEGLNIQYDNAAWPGPVRSGTMPSKIQVSTTARWLKENMPEYNDDPASRHGE